MKDRKWLTAVLCITLVFPAAAKDRDEQYYAGLIRRQEEEIQKLDAYNQAEEDKIREKRDPADNRRIDDALDEFYRNAGAANIITAVDDDKARDTIQFIEQLKETIALLEPEDETGESTAFLKAELQKAYDELNSTTFTTSSVNSSLTIRGSTYRLKKNDWTLTFYSTLLGRTDLFSTEIDIDFYQLTGRDYTPRTLQTREQIEFYNQAIEMYDSFFRQAVPILYARLSYTIQPWKKASEYRFVPQTLTIYHSDTNKILASYDRLDMTPVIFTVYPQIDIRTKQEKDADNTRANQILELEHNEEKRRTQASALSEPGRNTQKKRNTVYATANTVLSQSDFSPLEPDNIGLETLGINAVLGIGKFGHAGLMFGYDYNDGAKKSYTMGFTGGLNVTLAKCLRPVLEFQTFYQTDKRVSAAAGLGLDFIFGRGMLTLGYDFTAKYYIKDSQERGSFAPEDIKLLHSFKAGMGISW